MNETSHPSHTHRSGSSSRKRTSGSHGYKAYLQPVAYFSGAIIILIAARLLHSDLFCPAFGTLGIVVLAVSKSLRFKPGIFISIACISVMTMLFLWQWIDSYFVAILAGQVDTKPGMFGKVLTESLILAFLVWIYHRLMNATHLRTSQKWFVKSRYIRFFKLLFYFLLFLLFFWITAYFMQKIQSFDSLETRDSIIIAAALALLLSGIPAIIYLIRISGDGKKNHAHHHSHRSHRNSQPKNSDLP